MSGTSGRRRLVALVVAVGLPLLAVGAEAGVPGSDGLVHACYVKSGRQAGKLRVTDPPAIPACKSTEIALEWPHRAWLPGGNAGTTAGTDFLGTTDNAALELKVNGQRALRLEPSGSSPNVLGGSAANSISAGMRGATIGGGGDASLPNRVTDDWGTVAGGSNNRAGDDAGTVGDRRWAFVGGGVSNTASGQFATVGGGLNSTASGLYATVGGGTGNGASAEAATVGGGLGNSASGTGATVAGGGGQNGHNRASGSWGTVGGGFGNTASGTSSTVPGGALNVAGGQHSFAAGRQAKANHRGSFVWGDDTAADIASMDVNQFHARASGGVFFWSNGAATTGVWLPPGGGSWSPLSDRGAKEHFAPVDGLTTLKLLAGVPIESWNYRAQPDSVRHLGPTAQDFYAAFGLGESERRISTVDADGVAFSAIQGLYRLVQAREAKVSRLAARNAALEARVERLERLVDTLAKK